MLRVFIGIGSNIGDREGNCRHALEFLGRLGITVVKESSPVETDPWGGIDQPRFVNQVIEISTDLNPRQLLDVLLDIEQVMGRIRTVRWGPRVIDLDILLYGDLVIDEDGLTIPHPRLHERGFVLGPLAEIAPDTIHPVLGRTISALKIENSA